MRSLDWSRLWWLVETEAAFQVACSVERWVTRAVLVGPSVLSPARNLTRLRAWARSYLREHSVVVP